MYDHAALYRHERDLFDSAIQRVLASGRLDWGEEAPAFEAEFAAWLGVRRAVGTNSGGAALKVALRALGIGPGDEVITTPNSDIMTTAAIHSVGAKAVWVDVEPDTANMDPDAAAAAIGPRTRALLPVDLYGHPADMDRLNELATRHGLPVVADACLSLGASIEGRPVGTLATITCFSFAPTKHLGAFGTAGMAVTADPALADRMERLIAYGQDRTRHYKTFGTGAMLHHVEEGMNERLDEMQAAVLRAKLPRLAASIERRRDLAAIYGRTLAGSAVTAPPERPGVRHTYRNYVVHLDRRDAVRETLAAAQIATALPYAPPLHLQPVYRDLGHGRGAFPVTERLAERLLGVPVGPHLSDAQCAFAAETLRAASTQI